MNEVKTLLVGGSGIGSVELVNQVPLDVIHQDGSLVSVVIQIIIGVVTLFGLLKKKK